MRRVANCYTPFTYFTLLYAANRNGVCVCVCVCDAADLRRSDTADYSCWAASETGVTRSRAARLSVDVPSSGAVVFRRAPRPDAFPAPPGRPSAAAVADTTVRLAWRAPGNEGASPLTGYAVDYFSHALGQVPVCLLSQLETHLFCSLAVLDPRVSHTTDVLSPFISLLCSSDWPRVGSGAV